jgi:hypothetical protein
MGVSRPFIGLLAAVKVDPAEFHQEGVARRAMASPEATGGLRVEGLALVTDPLKR